MPPDQTASAVLDALFADAPIGLAFWDRELRYQRINPQLAAMNGPSVEEHIGRTPSEILPELGPRLEKICRRVLDTGTAVRDLDLEGQTPSAPGVTRHWLASYFPVTAGDWPPLGVTGLVIEVTGERHALSLADAALERSESVDAELRALYAASPVGVAFLDKDLRYRRVNDTLARMNGRSVEDHMGASLEEILGESAPALREALQRVVATREPLEFELTIELPHDPGHERAFEATYFPVLAGDDELVGVGGVVRDVTDRHELELEQSRLLREALVARAQAEGAQVRADDARVEAEQARARVAFLASAGRRMSESVEWEATLRAVVESAVPDLADLCLLTVVEPGGRLRVATLAHADPERERLAWELARRFPPEPAADHGVAQVIRSGEPELANDLDAAAIAAFARDEEHARLLSGLDVRHLAMLPLQTATGVIGALTLTLGESGRRFGPEELELVTELAARAAVHVQNARLYTERSHIAQTLEASLRPRDLPSIPGVQLAARYRPAGAENEVGGDFYEVFLSGDRVWTVIVGDVSGKGAEAAAITALARHTLRAASMLHDDPADNLALLNRALDTETTTPNFCTVLYARLCPDGGGLDVRFANGGHPAPLVLRPGGAIERVEGGRGPLVGVLPAARFTEGQMRLEPGELLLIHTDGVTEVRVSDVDLGERELHATLAAHTGASAEEVVAAVEARAVELQDGAPRDDIAIVAIKVDPTQDGSAGTLAV